MAGDVVVKIDADTAAYIAKLSKMADAHEKVKQKTDDSGASIGNATSNLLKQVGVLSTILATVQAIGSAYNSANEAAGKLSQGYGGSLLAGGTAARQLGMDPKRAEAYAQSLLQSTPTTSSADLQQFAQGLAAHSNSFNGQVDKRSSYAVTPEVAEIATSALKAYGPAALPGMLQWVTGVGYARNPDAVRKRIAAEVGRANVNGQILPESAAKEAETRMVESNTQNLTASEYFDEGLERRQGDAIRERNKIVNPFAHGLLNTVDWIPGVNAAAEAAQRSQAAGRARGQAMQRQDDAVQWRQTLHDDSRNVLP